MNPVELFWLIVLGGLQGEYHLLVVVLFNVLLLSPGSLMLGEGDTELDPGAPLCFRLGSNN